MSIVSNRQTQQPSLALSSVKCILASRAFVRDYTSALTNNSPGARIDATDPSGWTDLGAVMKSKVAMTYNKDYADVRSGLDGVYKTSYVTSKTCEWSFALDNYDNLVIAALTGTAASTSTAGGSTGYRFWIGKEDVVEKQLLIVGTNKIDNKEHQYWAPSAILKFAWEEDGDAIVVRVTATLRAVDFKNSIATSGETASGDSFYQVTIWGGV